MLFLIGQEKDSDVIFILSMLPVFLYLYRCYIYPQQTRYFPTVYTRGSAELLQDGSGIHHARVVPLTHALEHEKQRGSTDVRMNLDILDTCGVHAARCPRHAATAMRRASAISRPN